MIADVAIAGAGPAGAALAIEAARRGLRVILLDRSRTPPDKACGEGILPEGARRLAELGVEIDARDAAPIAGIRYVQENGSSACGRFASGPGLGVRRTALAAALWDRAHAAGVDLRPGVAVQGIGHDARGVTVRTSAGPLRAALAVAADGLHSRLRRAAGLELQTTGPRRLGVRRHFRITPWTELVEVHWARGVEAYVTPAGTDRVGVAFLLHEGVGPADVDALLPRFPALRSRLAGAEAEAGDRGAGPFLQAVRRRTADRLALIGDAAGYVDAITGEGISLALACAADLAGLLPDALAAGAGAASLAPYERAAAARFESYARVARMVLALSRHPALRRVLVGAGARLPAVFEVVLRAAVDGSVTPARADRRPA